MFHKKIFQIIVVILVLSVKNLSLTESTNQQQYYQPTASEVMNFMQQNTKLLQKMQQNSPHTSEQNVDGSFNDDLSSKDKTDSSMMQAHSDGDNMEPMPSGTIERLANDPDLIRQIANKNYGIPIEGRNVVTSNLPVGPGDSGSGTDLSPHSKSDIDRIGHLKEMKMVKTGKFAGIAFDGPKKCYVCQWSMAKCENFNCQNQPDICTNNHFKAHKVPQQECQYGCEQFVVTDPNGLIQLWRRGCAPPNLPVKRHYRCASHYEFGIRIDQCICNRHHCNSSVSLFSFKQIAVLLIVSSLSFFMFVSNCWYF